MVDYSPLMSSVLVASTAFLGLTLVHLGQLRANVVEKQELKLATEYLLWSFMTGIFAVLFALLWFVGHWPWPVLMATIAFLFQINLFWPVVIKLRASTRRK